MIKKLGDVVLIQLSDMDSNIYIIGDTVIDSGTGLNFTRMQDMLRVMGKKLDGFRQVINTHEHFDHIGGNGFFFGAKIAAHPEAAEVIENADAEMSLVEFFDGNLKPKKVDFKVKEGEKIDAGGLSLEIIYTPGHTPGSICLYDRKTATLFSGDTVFADGVGRTDTPGGDAAALQASLEKLANLKIERILPGHGRTIEKGGSKIISCFAKAGVMPVDEDDESLLGKPV